MEKGDKVHINFRCLERWGQFVFDTEVIPRNVLQHPFIVDAIFEEKTALLESVKTGQRIEVPLSFVYLTTGAK